MMYIRLLQISASALEQSAGIAEKDPHGVIISIISISVVFLSLTILYMAYELIGLIVNRWFVSKEVREDMEEDACGTEEHDTESYKITICRKVCHVQTTADRGIRMNMTAGNDEENGILQSTPSVVSDTVVKAPLPGTVLKILVREGDKVSPGQNVAVLEAMKMENTIEAERGGTVTKIYVSQGDSVLEGGEIMNVE